MKKQLTSVLSKYQLGGLTEESVWTVKNNNLFVKFKSSDTSVMGLIRLTDFNHSDSQFGVSDVSKVIQGISSLDLDATLDINVEKMYIEFKDKDVTNRRTICDISIIELENPNPENSTNFTKEQFDIEIKVDEQFYSKLNKIKNISTNNIGIKPENNTNAKVIVNYSVNNVDTGSFDIELIKGIPVSNPMLFNFDTFMKVLNANKDMKNGRILISSELNVAQFIFKNEDINSLYYMVSQLA